MESNLQAQLDQVIRRTNHNTDLDNLIWGYSICAKAEGKSPKTISITATSIKKFIGFLKSHDYCLDVTEIKTQEIREFILYLQQVKTFAHHPFTSPQTKNLSGHSISCYLRAIKAFWSWLVREEIILSNPFYKIRLPKPPKKIIPTFSNLQIRDLLRIIVTSQPLGFRNHTMILTLLDTGIRASELIGITINDINLEEGVIKVYGKGSKERIVPIGNRVQRAIWKYLHSYRPEPMNPLCTTLFLNRSGDPFMVNGLESVIEKLGRKAGIRGVRCSPHTFRHTFAVTYLRNGGDVFSLQRILGHSSLEVVRHYVNLAEADVKSSHRKYSPIDNMDLRKSGQKGKDYTSILG